MMNVLDLFSGIGGFSLGLESTGFFKTIAFVEKDRFCQKVLQKNFPNVPIEDEIRNVKGSRYQADVVTGGFPCQPFSVAGKRKGTDDDRYLWDEMLRVIAETKPKWIVGENVAGIINIENGTVLRQIQKDLESEGFQVQCLIIPASGIGAWHQRKRIFVIGCNVSNSNTGLCIGENKEIQARRIASNNGGQDVSNSKSIRSGKSRNTYQKKRLEESNSTQFDSRSKDVSNSSCNKYRNSTTRQSGDEQVRRFSFKKEEQTSHDLRSKTSRCSSQNVSNSNSRNVEARRERQRKIRKEHTEERLSSDASSIREAPTKSWWQREEETLTKLRLFPDGLSSELDKNRANRIKALGNSIVPQIAFEIGRAIIRAEEQQT